MIGSLFSGIGGLELGLERAGLGAVAWQVECDPFCLRVLARHWPHVNRFDDVRAVSAANLLPVDGICGGFPCQDVSSAGRRAGLDGARSGLWFEYARIISELRPRWVIVENVTSGETAWLPRVQHDLVSLGYRCEAWRLGAVDVGAPHRRLRTFVLAVGNASSAGLEKRCEQRGNARQELPAAERAGLLGNADAQRQRQSRRIEPDQRRRAQDTGDPGLANTDRGEDQQQSGRRVGSGRTGAAEPFEAGLRQDGNADAQREMGRGSHGISAGLDGHRWPAGRGQEQEAWEPPRTARRGEIPENAARLRTLGNAVVPQVAEMIGRRMLVMLEAS